METESLWLWHTAKKWKKMCQDPWHNNMSKCSLWFLHASDDLWCYFPHQMNLALINELLNAFLRNSETSEEKVLIGSIRFVWFFYLFYTFICHEAITVCTLHSILEQPLWQSGGGIWSLNKTDIPERQDQFSRSISFKYSLLWLVMSDGFQVPEEYT